MERQYQWQDTTNGEGGPDLRQVRLYLVIYTVVLVVTLLVIFSSRALADCGAAPTPTPAPSATPGPYVATNTCVEVVSYAPGAAAWFQSLTESVDLLRFAVVGNGIITIFFVASAAFFLVWRGRWN